MQRLLSRSLNRKRHLIVCGPSQWNQIGRCVLLTFDTHNINCVVAVLEIQPFSHLNKTTTYHPIKKSQSVFHLQCVRFIMFLFFNMTFLFCCCFFFHIFSLVFSHFLGFTFHFYRSCYHLEHSIWIKKTIAKVILLILSEMIQIYRNRK